MATVTMCPSCHTAVDPDRTVCPKCWRPIPEPPKASDALRPDDPAPTGVRDDLASLVTCPRCAADRPRTLPDCPYCSPPAVAIAIVFPFGEWIMLSGEPLLIGRGPDCPFAAQLVANLSISRSHARFDFDGRTLLMIDLGSTNGSFVNGAQLAPGVPSEVRPPDTIRFGRDAPVEAQLRDRTGRT